MKFVCVIPVREGSKRFPNKNRSLIDKLPLFKYSFVQASNIFGLHQVFINTDDNEIISKCEMEHINYYTRPSNLAGDHSSTVEVLKDFVDTKCFKDDDVIVLFQATNPLRKKIWIEEMVDIMKTEKYTSVISFSPLKEKKFGFIRENKFIPESYAIGQRSQDIENRYYENGLIYMTTVAEIKKGNIFTDKMFPYIIDDICASVDIDYPEDLKFANFLINSGVYNEKF